MITAMYVVCAIDLLLFLALAARVRVADIHGLPQEIEVEIPMSDFSQVEQTLSAPLNIFQSLLGGIIGDQGGSSGGYTGPDRWADLAGVDMTAKRYGPSNGSVEWHDAIGTADENTLAARDCAEALTSMYGRPVLLTVAQFGELQRIVGSSPGPYIYAEKWYNSGRSIEELPGGGSGSGSTATAGGAAGGVKAAVSNVDWKSLGKAALFVGGAVLLGYGAYRGIKAVA